MPYYPKKRTFKKTYKKYVPKQSINKAVSKVLASKAETKFAGREVYNRGSLTSGTLVYVQDVSDVASGSDNSTRIGDKISPYGLHLNYIVTNTVSNPVYVRIMVISCSRATGNATDPFLQDANGDGQSFTPNLVDDIARLPFKKQIKVLSDKIHRLAGDGQGTGIETVMKKHLIKLSGSRTFRSSSGSLDSEYNNIRVLIAVRGNKSQISTVEMTMETKYYFKDY